ncbi:hypothetical protein HA075_25135 [bacterium BFN5]|nr:hypothetical protein HA075_25135 [bacterium BFN5]
MTNRRFKPPDRLSTESCSFSANPSSAFAYYGWDITDDPVPYYHQQAGFWYYTNDTKTFMIEFNERTYKYVFERNGSFLGGYVTDMPLKLP